VGETPNLAARLQALAEPGAVVIASSTRRLIGGLFDYRDLGTVALKGFAENVPAWQLLGAGAAESRFEALHSTTTPLIGRDGRTRHLKALLAQVEGLAKRGPVLMVVEDAHWIDPTSLELIDLPIDQVPTLPVLVIITFRPEFTPRWIGRPHVSLLSLNRLPPRRGSRGCGLPRRQRDGRDFSRHADRCGGARRHDGIVQAHEAAGAAACPVHAGRRPGADQRRGACSAG